MLDCQLLQGKCIFSISLYFDVDKVIFINVPDVELYALAYFFLPTYLYLFLQTMSKNWLSDAVIQQTLEIPSDSNLDFSDAQSDDDLAKIRQITEQLEDSTDSESEVRNLSSSQRNEVQNQTESTQIQTISPQPSTSRYFCPTSLRRVSSNAATSPITAPSTNSTLATRIPIPTRTKKRNYVWRKKTFQVEPLPFTGKTELQSPFIDYETPLQFFLHFFYENLLQHIIEETSKFSTQKNAAKPFQITTIELQKYLGICLLMSLAPLPNIRMYWQCELGVPLIRETMTLNHFEKIRQFLHFNDNSSQPPRGSPGHDRLHKIRPILETLKRK